MGTIIETSPIFSPMMTKNKWKKAPVFYLGCLISVLALAYIKIGPLMAKGNVFRGIAINELAFILLPGLYVRNRLSLRESRKIEGDKLAYVSLAILSAFPLILLLNGAFLQGISHFIELDNDGLEVLRNKQPFLRQILYLAIIPSFAEEVMFRGLLTRVFLRYWRTFALLLSALIFALFHFEIQNFMAPFLFGLILAYIYMKLGHLFYVIYGHFLHNFISILFLQFYSEASINRLGNISLVQSLGGVQSILMIFLLLIALACIFGLRKALAWIGTNEQELPRPIGLSPGALIPYLLLVIVYIYANTLGGIV